MGSNEIHLWRMNLDDIETPENEMLEVLDKNERARVFRLSHPKSRFCYTRSHFALRQILAEYLGKAPEAITFQIGQNGKPETQDLCFSLSHSSSLAICGISIGYEIGVDVEKVRSVQRLDELVHRFFSPVEAREVLVSTQKTVRFFEIWTAKEAYLKALGVGLIGHKISPEGFHFSSLSLPSGYVGALAVQEPSMSIVYRDWYER